MQNSQIRSHDTIAEQFVLLAAIENAETMFDDRYTKQSQQDLIQQYIFAYSTIAWIRVWELLNVLYKLKKQPTALNKCCKFSYITLILKLKASEDDILRLNPQQ